MTGARASSWLRAAAIACPAAVMASGTAAQAVRGVQGRFITVPAGEFRSVLPAAGLGGARLVRIEPFEIAETPVTNAQFLGFVRADGEWSRDRIAPIFADREYLAHWSRPGELGAAAQPDQPVTNVSWFAASAYCEAVGARLPTWDEYEYLLAADETSRDARADPAWRERMLAWYSRPSTGALAPVGKTPANVYGVRDLHGLVWEWVLDFNALLLSGDNREQGDPDRLKFCGAGALAVVDRENYPILMRLALLSSLEAAHTTRNLGFRCARDSRGGSGQ
ncbi:MAG: formylglycine-generating enzyme family protein [Steroidobacteraceae bacterium]